MISSVGSTGSVAYTQQNSRAGSTLTEDQKTKLQEIIANYDPENMDEESTKAMMEEIKSAGITPGKEFGDIMNEAGFKPPEKPQGGMQGPPPSEGTQSVPQFVTDFIELQESGEATQEDVDNFVQMMKEMGINDTGLLVNKKV